jgi:hypothetical protein
MIRKEIAELMNHGLSTVQRTVPDIIMFLFALQRNELFFYLKEKFDTDKLNAQDLPIELSDYQKISSNAQEIQKEFAKLFPEFSAINRVLFVFENREIQYGWYEHAFSAEDEQEIEDRLDQMENGEPNSVKTAYLN